MLKNPFVVQKVCNYGVTNPIVARCLFQWFDIIQWAKIEDKDELTKSLKKIQDTLLSCYEIYSDFKSQVDEAEKKWMSQTDIASNRAVNIPSIVGLDVKVSHFLTNTKHVLRSFSGYFQPIFGDEPKTKNGELALVYTTDALNWASSKFGPECFLTSHLRDMASPEHPVTHIRNLRDANEHPGGRSGHLHIDNFQYKDGHLTAPTWHLNDKNPSSIVLDMEQIIDILLCASEHTMLACLDIAWSHNGMMVMYEIPPEDRDPAAPIRYRVTLHPKIRLPA